MTYVRPTFRHPDLPKNKINFTKKDYEGAIKDLKRVVKTLQDYNDQDGLGLAHKYLGNAFNEQKKYDEALKQLAGADAPAFAALVADRWRFRSAKIIRMRTPRRERTTRRHIQG